MSLRYWEVILSKEFLGNTFSLDKNSIIFYRGFIPYQNNGGTVVSINLENFSILASDTRVSSGFSIPSRECLRIMKISKNIILSSSGMQVDILVLQDEFKKIVDLVETENKKNIPISSAAFILSSILYSRRFFPYYSFNILSGKESNGKIKGFSFDAVGSFESCVATSSGTGQHFIQPILDNQIRCLSSNNSPKKYNILKIILMVKHLFLKASKKNIEIGDGIQIFVFTKKGVLVENSILKCD